MHLRAALVSGLVAFVVFGMFTYNLTKLYFCVWWVLLGIVLCPGAPTQAPAFRAHQNEQAVE